MPRTKSFDVDEALERAVELFWLNGFAATSMEDLVQHLGINRGSLYATFGSKEQLYERALNRYREQSVEWFNQLMDHDDRPLRHRVESLLMSSVVSENDWGCLMVNAAAERNAVHEGTKAITKCAVDDIRAKLIERLTGESLAIEPTEVAADYLIVTMQGLKVMSTMDIDPATLARVVDTAIDTVFGADQLGAE